MMRVHGDAHKVTNADPPLTRRHQLRHAIRYYAVSESFDRNVQHLQCELPLDLYGIQ